MNYFGRKKMEEQMMNENLNEIVTDGSDAKRAMKKVATYFLIVLVLQIPIGILVSKIIKSVPDNCASLVSVLLTQGYLLVSAIIYMIVTKTSLTKDLHVRKYKISTFFLSLVVLLAAAPMSSFLNIVSQLFAKNTTSTAIFNITEVLPLWAAILVVGCMPGFIEEVIFRGIIYSGFRKRSILTGMIISAVSFGFMHMNFNQMMYAVYLGIVFVLLNEATGSMASSMILHMIFNGYNTAVLFILPKLYEFLGQFSPEYANVNIEEAMGATPEKSQLFVMSAVIAPIAIAGCVGAWFLLKLIAKINGRELTWAKIRGDKEQTSLTKPINVIMILCWIFCFVMCVSALFA